MEVRQPMSDASTDTSTGTSTGTSNDDTIAETPVAPPKTTLSITVDGKRHEAEPGQLVIDACADAGVYVPHFCYHPRMSPVGMCRQCLVEVEGPRGPMMVVSCMTPVSEGQVVNTATPVIKRAQEGVLELLLANHPLDCPVCDKGGECPLQDQAMSHGPGESRYVEEKRHYEKPIPISDLVYLDRERCILCDRCTRFADEVAGDPLISFTHRGNNTQVLTFPDEPFSSYFSGNTVQICPVGALTAKPYRFKARPWDLEEVESTCTTCSVGCQITVQSSRNQLVRYLGVDSDPVNWGWMCDRGRFSFESLQSADRLTAPLVRTAEGLTETTWSAAYATAAGLIREALDESGPGGVALLGGARGTNEDAHAWALLADALGVAQRDPQLDDGLPATIFDLPQATIDQAAAASTIVLLAPDLKEELPVLYLRLRDAAEKRRSRLVEITSRGTGLTRYTWQSVTALPGTQAAVAADLMSQPEVAAQLGSGDVVVVVGRANLAEAPEHTLAALQVILGAAPSARVLPVLRRGNVRGALAAGLAPAASAGSRSILEAAAAGRIGCLVLLGADPAADVPDADLARRALAGARRVIAVDTFLSRSTSHADVVLAASGFAEKAGTTTNLEGRVTSVAKRVTAPGTARPDWMIAVELADALGHDLGIGSLDDVQASLAARGPAFTSVFGTLPGTPDGVVIGQGSAGSGSLGNVVAPAAPERNSYDYRLVVGRRLYDQAAGTQQSPSLAGLAPGARLHVHPLDLDRLGAADGHEVKVSSPRSTVIMPVFADPAVARGSVWAALNQGGPDVAALIDATASVIDVRVESLS
jgi:NADH-quinone oxidoreductase subunit G